MAQADCLGHWSVEREPAPTHDDGVGDSANGDDGYYCRHCGYFASGYGGRDCPGCGSN